MLDVTILAFPHLEGLVLDHHLRRSSDNWLLLSALLYVNVSS
jgi:hypothetical protein